MPARPAALFALMVAVTGVALAALPPFFAPQGATAQTSGEEGPWREAQSLTSDDPTFGELLAISGDLLVIGGDQFPLAVFEAGVSGEWAQSGSISPPAGFEYGSETQPTAVATDGTSVVVGGETGAWLFQRGGDGLWEQRAWLAIPTGPFTNAVKSVAVEGDLAAVANSSKAYAFGAVEGGVGSWGRLDRDWPTNGWAVEVDGLALLMTEESGFVYAVRRAQIPACRTVAPPVEGCYVIATTIAQDLTASRSSVGLASTDGRIAVGIADSGQTTNPQILIAEFRGTSYGQGTFVALPAGARTSQLAISGNDVLVGGRVLSEPVIFALSSVDAFSTPQVLRPRPFTGFAASQGTLAVGGGGTVTLFRATGLEEATPESPTPPASESGTPEPSPTSANSDDLTPTSPANDATPPQATAAATASEPGEAEATGSPDADSTSDRTGASEGTPESADSQAEDGSEDDGAPILQIVLVAVGFLGVLTLGALGGYAMRARASR